MTRGIAWPTALASAAVGALVLGLLLVPPEELSLDILAFPTAVLSVTLVGGFLVAKVPGNRVGWLLLLAGLLWAGMILTWGYGARSLTVSAGAWPGTVLAAWLVNVLWLPPILIVTVAVPLVFPDGHLPSPRWRPVAVVFAVTLVASTLEPALNAGRIAGGALENPLGTPGIEPLLGAADAIATLMGLLAAIGAVAAVATRYRRGHSIEREQIKWLLAVTGGAAVALPIAIGAQLAGAELASTIAWLVVFFAIVCLPVAIGIAVLRYRLYEIDRLISRTIGWALVTGLLVAVFAGAVVALQAALAGVTQGQTLAVAASTLVAFALFQPLRRRVQRSVDRRFDRARYDADHVVAAFAERLRDEVDLDTLATEVQQVASETVRPMSTAVWLRRIVPESPGSRSS